MSLIRAIKHRLGLSVTPANNFVLDASADNGTMKLARESGQDIMTVDAAGKVAFPQNILVAIRASSVAGSVGGDSSYTPLTGWTIDSANSVNAGTITVGGTWVPPVAGWYQIDHQSAYSTSGVGGSVIGSRARKNAVVINIASVGVVGAGLIFPTVNGSCVRYFNGTTDILDVGAYQNSAVVATNVINSFSAILVQRG